MEYAQNCADISHFTAKKLSALSHTHADGTFHSFFSSLFFSPAKPTTLLFEIIETKKNREESLWLNSSGQPARSY